MAPSSYCAQLNHPVSEDAKALPWRFQGLSAGLVLERHWHFQCHWQPMRFECRNMQVSISQNQSISCFIYRNIKIYQDISRYINIYQGISMHAIVWRAHMIIKNAGSFKNCCSFLHFVTRFPIPLHARHVRLSGQGYKPARKNANVTVSTCLRYMHVRGAPQSPTIGKTPIEVAT